MHEFGLCEAIVHTARQRAGGRPVARIKVRVGSLLRAESESMDLAYSMVAAGTELDGSSFEMVEVPATATCRSCSRIFEASEQWDVCPGCGGGDIGVEDGRGMVLEEIEYRPDAEEVP